MRSDKLYRRDVIVLASTSLLLAAAAPLIPFPRKVSFFADASPFPGCGISAAFVASRPLRPKPFYFSTASPSRPALRGPSAPSFGDVSPPSPPLSARSPRASFRRSRRPAASALFARSPSLGGPPSDPWAVLGVDPTRDLKKIKRAYRRLAIRYHPDVNREDPDAESKFVEINDGKCGLEPCVAYL
mmetsp:Transcript_8945/g.19763  ORF Transcript_8945/g.19763 Transcript_8945/m.19763 type:complete len:186 (-) Transcript_8945:111-668(-)